jgi:hypothetical protein
MYNDSVEGNNRIFIEGEYGIRADLDGDVREMLENNIFRKLIPD